MKSQTPALMENITYWKKGVTSKSLRAQINTLYSPTQQIKRTSLAIFSEKGELSSLLKSRRTHGYSHYFPGRLKNFLLRCVTSQEKLAWAGQMGAQDCQPLSSSLGFSHTAQPALWIKNPGLIARVLPDPSLLLFPPSPLPCGGGQQCEHVLQKRN